MAESTYYHLPAITLLDVRGNDAEKITNNLTTNAVVSLANGCCVETFITDVKGKTVGHVFLYRVGESFRLIGPPGQSEAIAAHFDRYTIVEDATVSEPQGPLAALVVPPQSAGQLISDGMDESTDVYQISGLQTHAYSLSWLGEGTLMVLVTQHDIPLAQRHLLGVGLCEADADEFHRARVLAGFPWYGIDFDEKNLPQEVGRDQQAISFTKGCYLGQETVARLDAMGQVQKKLVRWSVKGEIPDANVEVVSGEKTVGRLTSISRTTENEAIAIGIARRSHFDAGAQAKGATDKGEFTAVVV